MQQAVKSGVADAKLTLAEVLDWLVEDGMVAREAADALKTERRYHRGNVHPLCVVAEQKWKKGTAPLTLDALSEWLAKRLGRFARDEPVLDQPVEDFRQGQPGVSYAGLNCLLHRAKLYRNGLRAPVPNARNGAAERRTLR